MEKYIEDITYSWHFNHMQHYGTTKIGCPVYLWHIITTYYICTYSFSADIHIGFSYAVPENLEQQPKENVTVLTSSTKTSVVIRRGAARENLRSSSCCACSAVTAWPVRALSKCTYACLGSVSHIPFSSTNWKNHSIIRSCSVNISCNLYAIFTRMRLIFLKLLFSKAHTKTISIYSHLQET